MNDHVLFPRALFFDKMFRTGKANEIFAFIDLVALAEIEETMVYVKGQVLTVHRGEIATSVRSLSERWGWSTNTVTNTLNKLELIRKIKRRKSNVTSIISIVNYDSFVTYCNAESNATEDVVKDAEHPSRARVIDDSLSCELELFNNPPTHKQESKDSVCSAPQGAKAKRSVFVPPALEEVSQYCSEKGLVMDPEEFFDHFTSNGWLVSGKAKMQDWKAAVRNWARNQKKFGRPQEQQKDNKAYERKPINYIKPEDDPNYKSQQ